MNPLRDALRFDSAFWRRMALWGAARGPKVWLWASPPAIGLVFTMIAKRERENVHRMLRMILGHRSAAAERLDIARTFMCFASSLADSLALAGNGGYEAEVTVQGDSYLQDALDRKKGVVIVTAHTAGWEAALGALRKRISQRVLVVMQRERDEKARSFHGVDRKEDRLEVVTVGDDPLDSLSLLAHLRRGGVVAIQMDRCPKGMRAKTVRLFDRKWALPEGPLVLASLSGAPIVSVFSSRKGFLSYKLSIHRPLTLTRHPSTEEQNTAAQAIAGDFERFVRLDPTQWFHFVGLSEDGGG